MLQYYHLIPTPFLTILYEKKNGPTSLTTIRYALAFVLKVPIFVDASRVTTIHGNSLMPNAGLQELHRGGAMSAL